MGEVSINVRVDNKLLIPSFDQCLVNLFANSKETIKIEIFLFFDKEKVVISKTQNRANNEENGIFTTLQHSPVCPFKEVKIFSEKKIKVAVSILLESSDNHILLTRRPSHMSVSPNTWVPPGGHMEFGETPLEGGLRELYEETGIALEEGNVEAKIIGVWESVYPLVLGLGEPKSHILLIYYHIKSNKNQLELSQQIKIDPKEVISYTWLSSQALDEIFHPTDKKSKHVQYEWQDGKIVETELFFHSMFNRYIWASNEIYSGVQMALSYWYNTQIFNKHNSKI